MRFPRKRGATSVMITVFVPDNSVTTGAGLTTLTSSSANLVVGYRRELDSAYTEYKQSAGNIEAQTTIGTYQAPSSSSKVRIKHIARGQYEIQFHNSATAFGTGDASSFITIEIYEETTTALKIGPNAVLIPLSALTVLDGEANTIQIEGTDATDQIRDAVVDDATRIDASALNTLSGHDPGATLTKVADIPTATQILAQALAAETYAADGSVPTLSQMLYMIYSVLSQFSITGTQIKTYKLDGVTQAMTFLLDSGSDPTSRVRDS